MSDKNPRPSKNYFIPRQYYLYVKIHSKTGMKYLGRTAHKQPAKYLGSGIYWLRHLKKYGNEHITIVLGKYNSLESLKEAGLYYSKFWDIVKSEKWANLCEEDGNNETKNWRWLTPEMRSSNGKKGGAIGGKIMGPISYQLRIGVHGLTKEQRVKNSSIGGKISATKRLNDQQYKDIARKRMLENNPFKGKKHREETLAKMRLKKAGQIWITNGSVNKKVLKSDLQIWIDQGFRKGRTILWNVPKKYNKRSLL